MFLDHQIIMIDVKLKTEVMMLKIQPCYHRNKM